MLTYKSGGSLDGVNTFFYKAIMGSRAEEGLSDSHNALTGIDHLEKDERYNGSVYLYSELSEFAHPNHPGTLYSYSLSDLEKHETSFSKDKDRNNQIYNLVLKSVSATLVVFEEQYNEFGMELNKFTEWCNKERKANKQ